jgi:hemoglobin-like flavoprotein
MNVHDRAQETYVSHCVPILTVMAPAITQHMENKKAVRYPSLERIHKPGHRECISNVGVDNDFDYSRTTFFK